MNESSDITQELSALPVFGSDFKESLDSFFNQSPEARAEQLNTQVSETQQPTQLTEKAPVEVRRKEIKISDDPFADFSTDVEAKPDSVNPDEQEPDFEAELNEKFKEEPTDSKGKAKWGEIKGELKSVKQRAYQLERSVALKEKQLAEAQAAQATEQENLWKQKYEDVLKSNPDLALQEDQEFQQKVAQPYWGAKNFVDQAVSHFGLDRKSLAEAMQIPEVFIRSRKLAEIFNNAKEELLPEERAQVAGALQQEMVLESQYQEAQEKVVTLYEGAKQKQQEAKRQTYEQRKQLLLEEEKDVFDRLTKNVEFKSTFNGKASELQEKVKRALETESPPKMAVYEKYASYALAPTLQALGDAKQEIASLKASLAKYVQGGAAAGAGGQPSSSPSAEGDKFTRIGDDLANALSQAQGGSRWTNSKF